MASVPVVWVLRQQEVSRLPPRSLLPAMGWVGKGHDPDPSQHRHGVAPGCSPLGCSQRLVTRGRGTNPPSELEGKGAGATHAPLHAFPIQLAWPCIAWLWAVCTTMLGQKQKKMWGVPTVFNLAPGLGTHGFRAASTAPTCTRPQCHFGATQHLHQGCQCKRFCSPRNIFLLRAIRKRAVCRHRRGTWAVGDAPLAAGHHFATSCDSQVG